MIDKQRLFGAFGVFAVVFSVMIVGSISIGEYMHALIWVALVPVFAIAAYHNIGA